MTVRPRSLSEPDLSAVARFREAMQSADPSQSSSSSSSSAPPSSQVPNPNPSSNPTLKLQFKKDSPELEEASPERFSICHCHGDHGNYYSLTVEQDARFQHLMQDLQKHLVPGLAAGKADLSLRPARRTYSYTNETGKRTTEDLMPLLKNNPQLQKKITELDLFCAELAGTPGHIPYRLGQNSYRSLDRPNDVMSDADRALMTEALPRTLDEKPYLTAMTLLHKVETDPVKQQHAMQRMGRAEALITCLRHHVSTQIQALPPADPASDAKRRQRLLALQQYLERIDTFALYTALAFFPDGTDLTTDAGIQGVQQRAHELERATAEHIREVEAKISRNGAQNKLWFLPIFEQFRGDRIVTSKPEYAKDVGDLLLAALPVAYCRERHLHPGLEDILLRRTLNPTLENEAFEEILKEIEQAETARETLKGEIESEMKKACDVAVPASLPANAPSLVKRFTNAVKSKAGMTVSASTCIDPRPQVAGYRKNCGFSALVPVPPLPPAPAPIPAPPQPPNPAPLPPQPPAPALQAPVPTASSVSPVTKRNDPNSKEEEIPEDSSS